MKPWWTLLDQSLGFLIQSGLEYIQQPTSCSNATQRLETSGLDMLGPIYDPPDYGWSICRITNETDFENLQTI